jgi:hypothetical protein
MDKKLNFCRDSCLNNTLFFYFEMKPNLPKLSKNIDPPELTVAIIPICNKITFSEITIQ